MMNWLYYLLEANLYLVIFYTFYKIFLQKETFYAANRYYLIVSTLTAFLLPFLQLGFLTPDIALADTPTQQQIQQEMPLLSIENIFLFIYCSIVFIFLSKIVWGLRHIMALLKNPIKRVENGITIIELENTNAAFSFFNLLFIDPTLSQKNTVLKHEMVHINQKHSIDVMLFELIQISSWFNPITYFMKKDIKLIHEYLADQETTKTGIEKYDYAMFLIRNSCGDQSLTLTNQIFNSSILKRRISMLNQKKSAKWARLRLLLVLPVIGGMLCFSSMAFTKSYNTVQLGQKKQNLTISIQDTIKKKSDKRLPPPPPVEPNPAKIKNDRSKKVDEVRILPPIVKKDRKRLPPPIVVKDKKASSPPIVKKDRIKFSAPLKIEDKKAPPPPPIEPRPAKSKEELKIVESPKKKQ